MSSLVAPTQANLVLGQHITDNVIVDQDVMQSKRMKLLQGGLNDH